MNRCTGELGVVRSAVSCMLSLVVLASCGEYTGPQAGGAPDSTELWIPPAPVISPHTVPEPPDLSMCTRVEVSYAPSTLEYFFPNQEHRAVLSAAELQYIQSLKAVTVSDPQVVDALAQEVERGWYIPPRRGPFTFSTFRRFVCYRGNKRVTAFTAMWDVIVAESGHWFKYDGGFQGGGCIPQQIRQLSVRTRCAENLGHLQMDIWKYLQNGAEKIQLPCDGWCDALLRGIPEEREDIMKELAHHSGVEGQCDYALNANWRLDSPPDVVLLYEAIAGWNQCGGPELFSFDKHDPSGGCVLLNDGDIEAGHMPTILFIRSRARLNELRWQ